MNRVPDVDSGGRRTGHLDRSRARSWALQVHYRWESEGTEDRRFSDVLASTIESRRVARSRVPYLSRLVETIETHRPQIDGRLAEALDNWSLDRLSSIDRGILRIAAAEMLYQPDIPPKVSIQESLKLAERYGGEDSARFVNGVLDALYRSLPSH